MKDVMKTRETRGPTNYTPPTGDDAVGFNFLRSADGPIPVDHRMTKALFETLDKPEVSKMEQSARLKQEASRKVNIDVSLSAFPGQKQPVVDPRTTY